MSRVTAPIAKLSRALSSAPAAARSSNPLLDSTTHNGGAILMPKYAELLRNRSSEHSDSSRGLTTTHRPTPQPSLANRPKPLMQTFHSSSLKSAAPLNHIDCTLLPSMDSESATSSVTFRMPLLPDNYSTAHGPTTSDAPVVIPAIVAAVPERVEPATSLSAVEGIALDGVELKWVHESETQSDEVSSGGMLRDLWKGMVEDVLGPASKKAL